MGVKVVPFILFVLAGECLSSLTEHQQQVQDVLEKMYHKITGIDEKLSKIEKRVTDLENSQTTPMENKPTNLENAMIHLGEQSYRSLDEIPVQCKLYKNLTDITRLANNTEGEGEICDCIQEHMCDPSNDFHGDNWYRYAPDEKSAFRMADVSEITKLGQCGTSKGIFFNDENDYPDKLYETKPGKATIYNAHIIRDIKVTQCGTFFVFYLENLPFPEQCHARYCFTRVDPDEFTKNREYGYRSLHITKKLCFDHTELCNDEDLPDQCRTYNTLTDTNRLTARMHLDTGSVDEEPTRRGGDEKISDHSGDPNQSEEWQGEGWYRFKNGEPGIRMAVTREEKVSKKNCGATHGAYMKLDNRIPDGFGENRDSKVKFGSDIKDMKVTNCGRFFVYHLPDAPPDYGYCFVRVTLKDFEENVEVYEKSGDRCTELGGPCGPDSSGPPCCTDSHCDGHFCVAN